MEKVTVHFDEVLEHIGSLGPYQFYIIFLTGMVMASVGVHTLGAVFTAGIPDYHCVDDAALLASNTTANSSVPSDAVFNETVDSAPADQCYTSSGQECSHWEYDKQFYTSTITTEVGFFLKLRFYRTINGSEGI